MNASGFLLTKDHSNEDNKVVQEANGTAQDSNSNVTVQNKQGMGTGDLTASVCKCKVSSRRNS